MPRKKKVEEPAVETTPVEKKKPGRPKKSDTAVAAEIEVKKNVRKAGRKAKEAAEETVAAVKEAVADQAVATEIEVKKTVRKAGRKAKEVAETVIAETEKAAKKTALEIIIQSPMGGAITTDEIIKKIPKGSEAVYVRVDENRLYWVKGDETGSVEIWE